MVDDLNKVTRHEDFEINYKIQMAEIREYEKKLWENNRFCSCGADSIQECECEPEKQKRFRKRRKRKVNEKFSKELNRMMKGQLPKTGHQSRDDDDPNEEGSPW